MLHNYTQLLKRLSLYVLFILVLTTSCGTKRNLTYFNDIRSDSIVLSNVKPIHVIIASGDVLSIRVSSSDELTSARINGVSASPSGSATGVAAGATYLVNDSGFITMPLIGFVKATGLNKEQLGEKIKNILLDKKLLLDAIVNVRVTNFKITVIGEVNRPGVISVPEERITIVEALSTAGDLTIFGNRTNVLVIREQDGKRIYKRIDLTKNNVFTSSYYYLENHDIIYVEPIKKKASSLSNSNQIYSMVLSTVSIITLLYTQIVN